MRKIRMVFLVTAIGAAIWAITATASADQILTSLFGQKRSQVSDTVHLKSGEVLRGKVLNEALNLNTPYGFLRIPRPLLAGVSFGKTTGSDPGEVVTTNFNRMTGQITDWGIHFKPTGKVERTLAQNKIEFILFKIDAGEAETNGLDRDTNLFLMANGDRLTGKPNVAACDIRVGLIDEKIPLADIRTIERRNKGTPEISVTKKDGKNIVGTLNTKKVGLNLDIDIPMIDLYCQDFTKIYIGEGARQAATRFGIALPTVEGDTGGNRDDGAESITNSVGMTFNYVKPGSFVMGSPVNEKGRDRDEVQHTVTLTKGFYLQVTEVTQEQWSAVMDDNPSYFSECKTCPVERLLWQEIDQFLEKLNQKERGRTYRLPTEAEWEYAARAGTTGAYFFGNDPGLLGQYAWYQDNADHRSHPVGLKQPNPWGFFDIYGNVWEWCADWKGLYTDEDGIDPTGPSSGTFRVNRGGSWFDAASLCRSANRNDQANLRKEDWGLRLVLEVN